MAKAKKVSKMYKVGGSDGVTFKAISNHLKLEIAEKAFEKAKKLDVRFPYKKAGEDIEHIMLIEIPTDTGRRFDFHSLIDDLNGKKGKVISKK